MNITYKTTKNLPPEQLHKIFISVGWSDGGETPEMIEIGYTIPWVNSTLVVSAWDGEALIGVVRVLSDTLFRSVIYDLAVLPEYQGFGIGRELVRRCIATYPNSEWLVQTEPYIVGYYKKLGFVEYSDCVLSIPCKLFKNSD